MVKTMLSISSDVDGVHHLIVNDEDTVLDFDSDLIAAKTVVTASNELELELYNAYIHDNDDTPKQTIFKKILSCVVLFLICLCSSIDRLPCPYLIRKKITLQVCDNAICHIHIQSSKSGRAIFSVRCTNCKVIQESADVRVDLQELDEIYSERKKVISIFAAFSILITLLLACALIICRKYVSAVFLGIISIIFISCMFYSRYDLKKQWLSFRNDLK